MDEPITHSETEIKPAFKYPELPVKCAPATTRQFRQFNNTAVLWTNTGKRHETDRDCHGDATINGEFYFVRGWTVSKKNGQKYLRLYFSRTKPESCRWVYRYAKTPRTKHGAA